MQKSGFPKMRHCVGFWQIGSQNNGETYLKVHCVMQLSLSYKALDGIP